MKYQKYGKTDMMVSRFGFGCLRLPRKKEGEKSIIDQEETTRMVRYAIDHGVNYFDTAHAYEGSETALGIALQGGLREKVYIVGKNPVWDVKKQEDLFRFLDEELAMLQTSYLDVQFLHSLNSHHWKICRENGALDYLDKAKASGKIRYAGFSFHGNPDDFDEILDAYDWDIVQIQLNFLDTKHQAGLEGLKKAAARGMAVVIMEPLRGGALVDKLPEAVRRAYETFPVKRSPAEWSFRWLIDKPEVTSVLSGVSTMEQLQENIAIFSREEPGCMTADEQDLIQRVEKIFKSSYRVPCTRCGYCIPCPAGVEIPEIFQLYNDSGHPVYQEHACFMYKNSLVGQHSRGADQCVECGQCEEHCPQGIPIIQTLKEAHQALMA